MLTEKEDKKLDELLDLMNIANQNGYSYYVSSLKYANDELWNIIMDIGAKDFALLVSGNRFDLNDKYIIDDSTNGDIKTIKDDKELLTELETMEQEWLDFIEEA